MPKKVKVAESCVFTTSDGQHNLVDQAKEALTTLSKNKIDVYIVLDETSKDDAAKFLKDNSVPYKALITTDDKPEDGKSLHSTLVSCQRIRALSFCAILGRPSSPTLSTNSTVLSNPRLHRNSAWTTTGRIMLSGLQSPTRHKPSDRIKLNKLRSYHRVNFLSRHYFKMDLN